MNSIYDFNIISVENTVSLLKEIKNAFIMEEYIIYVSDRVRYRYIDEEDGEEEEFYDETFVKIYVDYKDETKSEYALINFMIEKNTLYDKFMIGEEVNIFAVYKELESIVINNNHIENSDNFHEMLADVFIE